MAVKERSPAGYEPPFERNARIDGFCMEIAEMVGSLAPASEFGMSPALHRRLRIRTIHSSLLIEGNGLTEDQVVYMSTENWATSSFKNGPLIHSCSASESLQSHSLVSSTR